MGRSKLWLALNLLCSSGAFAHGVGSGVPLAMTNVCQWLLLKSQGSLGKSTEEIGWVELYAAMRKAADNIPGAVGTLPEVVLNHGVIRKAFGRLTPGQRGQIVRALVERSYNDYRMALSDFKEALAVLREETLRVPQNTERVVETWKLARKAEGRAVKHEHHALAYVEGVKFLLDDLSAPYLSQYQFLHLRPEYNPEYWHMSPQLAEAMLLMSIKGHAEWEFSQHAIEQSELRGYSESLIRKGLTQGKFSVIEARPEHVDMWEPKDHHIPFESLRFKVKITDFSHERKLKHLVVIVKFSFNQDSNDPFRTVIITTWNQNIKDRFRDNIVAVADAHGISLKNQVFREKYRKANHYLLHELTQREITDLHAELVIRSIVKGLGAENARVVMRSTLDFMAREMPLANVRGTMESVYHSLYNHRL